MKSYQLIALERVRTLFREAGSSFKEHPKRSHRYVKLARTIAMKVKIKIPPLLKRQYCHHCYHFLMPGANCRVRTREGTLIYSCKHCKHYNRFPLRKKLKQTSSSPTRT